MPKKILLVDDDPDVLELLRITKPFSVRKLIERAEELLLHSPVCPKASAIA